MVKNFVSISEKGILKQYDAVNSSFLHFNWHVRELNLKRTGVDEVFMNDAMNELFLSFSEQSDIVQDCLSKILENVTEGKVPSSDDMQNLNNGVENLRQSYDTAYEAAKSAVSPEELPVHGSSIGSIMTAVKDSENNRILKQLSYAKNILEKFVSVRSIVEEYATALSSYQKEAQEILEQLTPSTIDDLYPKTEAPALFLQVMDMEPSAIHSSNGIAFMKKLKEFYHEDEIQFGLIGKMYFYDNSLSIGAVTEELQTNEPEISDKNPEENEDVKKAAAETETQTDTLQGTDLPDDSLNVPEKETGESEKPFEAAVNNEADAEGEVFTAVNKDYIAGPHPSNFKKELSTMCMNHVEVASILSLFTHFGFMNKYQLFLFGRYLDCFGEYNKEADRVYTAIDLLVCKGYLAFFNINDTVTEQNMTAYCLTSYCLNSMHTQEIESQLKSICGVSYGTVSLTADITLNAALASHFYYSNYVLLDYLDAQTSYLDSEDFRILAESVKWKQDHYQALLFSSDAQIEAYILPQYADITSIEDPDIILSLTYNECPKHFNSACKEIYAVKDSQIYPCQPECDIQDQIDFYNWLDSDDGRKLLNKFKEFNEDTEDESEDTQQSESEGEDDDDTCPVEKGKGEEAEEISSPQSTESVNEERETTEQNESAAADVETGETIANKLLYSDKIPSDEDFCHAIHALLNDRPEDERSLTNSMAEAVLLAKGASLEGNCTESRNLFTQLQLSANILRDDFAYSSLNLSNTFDGTETESPALALTAYMQAMLTPADSRDYSLKYKTEDYFNNYDAYFPELRSFRELFGVLMQIHDVNPAGFTSAVIIQLGDEEKQKQYIEELKAKAGKLLTYSRIDTRMKALPQMYWNEFGNKSSLYYCMSLISNGAADRDSLDFIGSILEEFCDYDGKNNTYMISTDKIEEQLDCAWNDVNRKNSFKLEYMARAQAIKQYKSRLEVMLAWVDTANAAEGSKATIGRLGKIRENILLQVSLIKDDDSWKTVNDANVLSWCLLYMSMYLNDEVSQLNIFEDVLRTGIFSITEEGTPEIDDSLAEIKYYEVWRNALRHITAERRDTEEIVSEILGETADSEDGLKDNLNQLNMLGKCLGSNDSIYSVSNSQIEEAEKSASFKKEQFKDNLELAYAYCRINETEKEDILGIVSQYEESFYETGDFACWRRFLEALEMQVQEFTANRKAVLEDRLLKQIENDRESAILSEAKRVLEEELNFAVAEEYLNRYEAGEKNLDTAENSNIDYFSDFLSDEVFNPLYTACLRSKGTSFRTFAWNYFGKDTPKKRAQRLQKDSRRLISSWPVRKNSSEPKDVKSLFECLGFSVKSAVKVKDTKEELWQVYVNPAKKELTDYLHPIAAFGTQMKSPLNTIFLYGSHTGQEIVDLVTSMNLGGIAIVFLDCYVNAAERRNIGEIFHTQKSGQNPFLVIDQVLMLYLAMHQETERLPAMLQCTLPYSTYQPFVRDAGFTADEMFCGRKRELDTIIDLNGASVVYGGRQLGKTALLQRAESLCSKPEVKKFAVYTSIVGMTAETDVVEHLIYDINRKASEQITLNDCSDFRDLCNQLGKLFSNGTISSMHLLIDEVDDFLEAIADEAYKPIQPLVDLKRDTNNNFKFVIAGLHNVCRAKNATKGNGIFGQLGTPLCVKPLSPSEAYQLLAKPLHYLGFKIDRSAHLETILTNTNYYPGILQFFGYSLVETLTTQYSKYYSATAGNPPFTLTDEQLGTIMNSADLNNSIKEKFRWSLELDNRYFMITRCITLLYHLYEDDTASGIWRGFAVDEIIEMANSYDIHCLREVGRSEYMTLLDEMAEMGILSRPEKGKNLYRLRRNSFLDIIGEDIETIEQDIKYNNV